MSSLLYLLAYFVYHNLTSTTHVEGQVTSGLNSGTYHSKPPLRPKSIELIVPRVPGLGLASLDSRLRLGGTDPNTVPRSGLTIPPALGCFLETGGGRSKSPDPGLPGTPRPWLTFWFLAESSDVLDSLSVLVVVMEEAGAATLAEGMALLRLVNCAIGLFNVRRVYRAPWSVRADIGDAVVAMMVSKPIRSNFSTSRIPVRA